MSPLPLSKVHELELKLVHDGCRYRERVVLIALNVEVILAQLLSMKRDS
jgi:hypothetical protein